MIRIPLRPLARILEARVQGENPQLIERENIRLRTEQARDAGRRRAEWRLLFLAVVFFAGYAVIGARMGLLAAPPWSKASLIKASRSPMPAPILWTATAGSWRPIW